jgi:hypothetical protein
MMAAMRAWMPGVVVLVELAEFVELVELVELVESVVVEAVVPTVGDPRKVSDSPVGVDAAVTLAVALAMADVVV